jgi:hypothetical protein
VSNKNQKHPLLSREGKKVDSVLDKLVLSVQWLFCARLCEFTIESKSLFSLSFCVSSQKGRLLSFSSSGIFDKKLAFSSFGGRRSKKKNQNNRVSDSF